MSFNATGRGLFSINPMEPLRECDTMSITERPKCQSLRNGSEMSTRPVAGGVSLDLMRYNESSVNIRLKVRIFHDNARQSVTFLQINVIRAAAEVCHSSRSDSTGGTLMAWQAGMPMPATIVRATQAKELKKSPAVRSQKRFSL